MRQRFSATPDNIYNKVCCYGEVLLYIIWSAIYIIRSASPFSENGHV